MLEVLGQCWMSDQELAHKLGDRVRRRLACFLEPIRRGARTVGSPQSVEGLCEDLKKLVTAGDPDLAFAATCTCAVIAELLVASRDGGIFPSEKTLNQSKRQKRIDKDQVSLLSTLGALRNACFHPAAMKVESGKLRHVQKLAELLRGREAALAAKLSAEYSQIRSPEMLAVAVRLVDELGIEELQR